MAGANANPNGLYGSDRSSVNSKVLIHSRTVVERKDYVSTGILMHSEGDLLEIEIAEYKDFQLGEPVKMTIYSPAGIHVLQTTVIGKYEGAIMVLHPPSHQLQFEDKRQSPRVDTKQTGSIHTVVLNGNVRYYEEELPFALKNISLQGVGIVFGTENSFRIGTTLHGSLELGFPLPCELRVVREEYWEEGNYYGAEFIGLNQEHIRNLRAFILKQQIENHAKFRGERLKQREFK